MTGYVRKTPPRPLPIPVHQPDWKAMLYAARRAGYSYAAIEAATGITKDRAVAIMAGGTNIIWAHGEALNTFAAHIREGKVHARESTS